LYENKSIPGETTKARNKLKSEALLEEEKVILGWLIDFCQLLILSPITSLSHGRTPSSN
jgi:hypothetical protein